MQFSEHWLRTMADPKMSSEALAHLLTMSGLEVEEVEPVAPPFSKVVVAKVLEVEKHPNADRLTVCKVDAGTGEILNIVCGAPNVRAGMTTMCALVGAELPPGEDGKAFAIKKGKLRGVESQGMLCSARELKLSDDHGGIMDLPTEAPVGKDSRDYLSLSDNTFTIKLTPNKADCLSVLGVAREVAALTGVPLVPPPHRTMAPTIETVLPVKIAAPDLCGRFTGRVIRGINAKAETPDWMKQRLERSGQRPISALVDISNYVMLESGQPNHIYDLNKIAGSLEIRWGRQGESVKLLNDTTVEVDDWVGVIADAQGVESLAGIMGGERTAVSLETTDIFLEAAFWWPNAIQGRSRRFNFATEAGHRFERGVDFAGTLQQIERMTALILDICGVEGHTQLGPIDDQIINLPQRAPVTLRTARAKKVIGVPFTDEQIAQIFTRLGLTFTQQPGSFTVTPPSWRFDIEIEEDLIEEVARVYGFENIPERPPVAPNVMRIAPESERSIFHVRHHLADLDYQEVVNYSFVEEAWEADLTGNTNPIKLLNPIASQMSVMRTTLIGSLIANVRYNLNRRVNRVRVFELGAVFLRTPNTQDGTLSVAGYAQPKRIAALAYGPVAEEQWGQPTHHADFFDIKGDLEALFAPKVLRFEKITHPALHPGRSAKVMLDGQDIGLIGELHPRWQQKYELPLAPVVFEVDAGALQAREVPMYRDISRFQPVSRDLALVVRQEVTVQSLLDAFHDEKMQNPACHILQAVVLFDEYRGKGLENHEKSLAFRFTLQDTLKTLQDEAVDAAMTALVAVASTRHGAKLRA